MRLYSEDRMKRAREALEKELFNKRDVKKKLMFGCPSYTVDDTLFGFLVSDGLVLTKLLEEDQIKALQIPGACVFEHKGRVAKNWVEVPLRNQDALPEILKWLWKSYEQARTPQH